MQLTGAEIIVECLKEQGVDTVFGYPGGAILNVYDALYEYKDQINHVLTSHEQGASHAAERIRAGYRESRRLLRYFRSGSHDLVTGIATAYMDSVPVVAITANVGTSLLGKDSFQEVDIAGIVIACDETQLHCKRYHKTGGHHPQGFLYCEKRPSGSRPGGCDLRT